jgi:uncharacterized membrane protein HdeD (DUF308 family)
MEKKRLNPRLKSLLVACVFLIMGILFICSLALGVSGLSYLIGTTLIVIGVLYIVISIVKRRGLLSTEGMIGCSVLSFGIMFMTHQLANIIVAYIPWLLISVGVAIILDALLRKFIKNDPSMAKFVCELVLGGITLVFGICVKFISALSGYAVAVLGAALVVFAFAMIISAVFFKKTDSYTQPPVEAEQTAVTTINN